MRRLNIAILLILLSVSCFGQGWPSEYGGVMLQGFYWNSYGDTKWTTLEKQSDELSESFDLIWVPQSGWCGSLTNMGYTPKYYWNQRSAFGTEQELRSMISTFRAKGTGIIADVVINHREPTNGWFGYPAETYQGVTYQMYSTDVCANDDGGKSSVQAAKEGLSLSSNNDTGEDWDGCRDLDHNSENVQKVIKAYVKYLIDDLGYTGFRYDMVKGYYAKFTAMYNMYAKPQFSVGEYWDSNQAIKKWIVESKGYESETPTSAAFDFQFRYSIRDAINNNDWTCLKSDNRLIADNYYKQYSVTFCENHDMEYRSASAQQDPIRRDTLQANAFMLAMPGTPCVFYKHWTDCKQDIKSMIEARKLAGITNTSNYTTKVSTKSYYGVEVTGRNATLYCIVGNASSVGSSMGGQYFGTNVPFVGAGNYVEILTGRGYRYLISREINTPWLDKASGDYQGPIDVRCVAASNYSDATLVYTTDGSIPTTSSSKIESGQTLHVDKDCVLTLGLVHEGRVVKTVQKKYQVAAFEPHTATIYCRPFNTLKDQWSTMNYYIWSGSSTQLNGNWPGKRIAETVEVGGQTWYCQTVDIPSYGYMVNVVFSTGSGSPQTVDVTGIQGDSFFVIKNSQVDGKYDVTDATSTYIDYVTGVEQVIIGESPVTPSTTAVYDLQGRRVTNVLPGHIYIRGGRKYLAR